MSETWTEYAVQWNDDPLDVQYLGRSMRSLEAAQDGAAWVRANTNFTPVIVGRQVTASDWLPVDTDGAK